MIEANGTGTEHLFSNLCRNLVDALAILGLRPFLATRCAECYLHKLLHSKRPKEFTRPLMRAPNAEANICATRRRSWRVPHQHLYPRTKFRAVCRCLIWHHLHQSRPRQQGIRPRGRPSERPTFAAAATELFVLDHIAINVHAEPLSRTDETTNDQPPAFTSAQWKAPHGNGHNKLLFRRIWSFRLCYLSYNACYCGTRSKRLLMGPYHVCMTINNRTHSRVHNS